MSVWYDLGSGTSPVEASIQAADLASPYSYHVAKDPHARVPNFSAKTAKQEVQSAC